MKFKTTTSLLFGIVLFAALVIPAAAQTVSGSLGNGSVARGSVVKGSIILTIPSGLHVNSNKPNSEYAIPTTVRLSGKGLSVSPVAFPRGTNRKFQFSEYELNVYEGRVVFPFRLTVPSGFRGKTVTAKAVVRFQACTEEICYPPKNKEVVMIAKVR